MALRDWSSYQINPVESWCDLYAKMVPDTMTDCPRWIDFKEYDAQMEKFGR